jgi:hypothetical protein
MMPSSVWYRSFCIRPHPFNSISSSIFFEDEDDGCENEDDGIHINFKVKAVLAHFSYCDELDLNQFLNMAQYGHGTTPKQKAEQRPVGYGPRAVSSG